MGRWMGGVERDDVLSYPFPSSFRLMRTTRELFIYRFSQTKEQSSIGEPLYFT